MLLHLTGTENGGQEGGVSLHIFTFTGVELSGSLLTQPKFANISLEFPGGSRDGSCLAFGLMT